MPSFEKFMKDLETRSDQKKKENEQLQRAEQNHNMRARVLRYAERWQNSIRFVGSFGRRK